MAFNHYAKIRRILLDNPGWVVRMVNKPTIAKKFNGEIASYDHYYRVYSASGKPLKYCKFQQLDRFASVMDMDINSLPLVTG